MYLSLPNHLRLYYFISLIPRILAVDGSLVSTQSVFYCTYRDQRAITQCAQPLYDLGAFKNDAESQTFTWDFFAQKSKEYFNDVCGLVKTFNFRTPCPRQRTVELHYQNRTLEPPDITDFIDFLRYLLARVLWLYVRVCIMTQEL